MQRGPGPDTCHQKLHAAGLRQRRRGSGLSGAWPHSGDLALRQLLTGAPFLQVLSAAADALAAQMRPDALRTVVAFADALPAHVPQSIYRELNRALNRTLQ